MIDSPVARLEVVQDYTNVQALMLGVFSKASSKTGFVDQPEKLHRHIGVVSADDVARRMAFKNTVVARLLGRIKQKIDHVSSLSKNVVDRAGAFVAHLPTIITGGIGSIVKPVGQGTGNKKTIKPRRSKNV